MKWILHVEGGVGPVLGPCAALSGGIGSGEGDRVARGLGGMLSDRSVKSAAPMCEGPLACAR
jgi:hypothetical protein